MSAYHPGQGRQRRVPGGTPPFSSPLINGGGFWLYEFDRPGTYDVFCAPHEFFGMVMRVVVGDPGDEAYEGVDEFGTSGRPPVSRGDLAGLGVTAWAFPTPREVFETAALAEDKVVSSESVPVSDSRTTSERRAGAGVALLSRHPTNDGVGTRIGDSAYRTRRPGVPRCPGPLRFSPATDRRSGAAR